MKTFSGKYERYPDWTSKRQAEGGRRLSGDKRSSREGEPLVTIVTVCFNSQKTIQQTFDSVRHQTYENIEYIVVDGGSSDDTVEIIKAHEDLIDYYVSEPDEGLYFAMNKGVELATGDYILILNSDDWYVTDAVEKLVGATGYSGCDFVSGLERHVHPNERTTGLTPVMHFDHSIYLRASIHHETMLVPRRIYDEVGSYNTDYRIVADIDFMIRLFEAGYTHYKLIKEIIYYRQTGLSSTDNDTMNREMFDMLQHKFPSLGEDEIARLSDRASWSGFDLLDLMYRHPDERRLINALQDYMRDHIDRALCGRGLHKKWQVYAEQLLESINTYNEARSPFVSVVMPVYKAEQTIDLAIKSVLQQSFEDLELICVNDQTPDDCQAIIDAYRVQDSRVRAVINERNVGPGASRNRGVREANGSYVFFVDPDDTIPDDALDVLATYAKQNRSELIRGAYFRRQGHGGNEFTPRTIHPLGQPETIINAKFEEVAQLLNSPEGHWAYLYRVDLLRRIAYPEDLSIGEDALLLHKILPAACSITIVPNVVYNYRDNPESAMSGFEFHKYINALEWRRRACCILEDCGLHDRAEYIRQRIPRLGWHDRFLDFYAGNPDVKLVEKTGRILRCIYDGYDAPGMGNEVPEIRKVFLQFLLAGNYAEAARQISANQDTKAADEDDRDEKNTKVSVILPVYNAEETLRRCIDSVLTQSLEEIELVCINDRSPDTSHMILDEYARGDRRVVVITNEGNVGLGASRNRGVAAATGEYVFHVDPDDVLVPGGLQNIYSCAARYGSDMTRGAYWHEQLLHGNSDIRKVRKGLAEGVEHIVNTTLENSTWLLNHTEGHWSYLYRAEFARQVKYPEDLKMGQDSLFIVNALVQARSISVTDVLVYHYCANPSSTMNTFNSRKFLDALEWRIRAWSLLCNSGLRGLGEFLLFRYWNPEFFVQLKMKLHEDEQENFDLKLADALQTAGYPGSGAASDSSVRGYLEGSLGALKTGSTPSVPEKMRVATLSSQDHGGAGTGSLRRVEALREHGVDAGLHVLFAKSEEPFVRTVPLKNVGISEQSSGATRAVFNKEVIVNRSNHPGLKARELFSKPRSLIDFRNMSAIFEQTDIVHLHWVVGMFDYEHADVLRDKPVVWTLADMNPFTGGCHYSEGCSNYQNECKHCPLLDEGSTLAHEAWKTKKNAYKELNNLHIICPSQWLAERVRESSLLGNRPIHVIPNALPVDRFKPTNRLVARRRLGLPLDRRFVAFGADYLNNKRKGGDILVESLRYMESQHLPENLEAIVFGTSTLNLGIKTHNMGYVPDDMTMALIYAAADVFAFPSREDNAPLTVVESMLSGTPVVGFCVGNVAELVDHMDTGYIAEYADPRDFAEGLSWVLSETGTTAGLRRRVRACRRARVHNDPQIAAERHVELYQSMINEKRTS